MRVKMRTLCAGPTGVWQPGQVVDVAPREAAELVAAGSAEAIDQAPALPRSGQRQGRETRPRVTPEAETRELREPEGDGETAADPEPEPSKPDPEPEPKSKPSRPPASPRSRRGK